MGEKLHMGFVDITKAHDSVNRELLWKKLESPGIDGVFLGTLKAMYSGYLVRCTVNGVTTSSIFSSVVCGKDAHSHRCCLLSTLWI